MNRTPPKPFVIVPTCSRQVGELPYHIVGKKYVDAVWLAGCQPLIVSPPETAGDVAALLAMTHGVLLTGSPSNVHPAHFGEAVLDPTLPLDPARDGWTLPLVRQVLAMGMPLLAICRGTQEVNVALGGTLHQAVHAVGPYDDHRAREGLNIEQQYDVTHPVVVERGGLLHAITGRDGFDVNSLHGQAVRDLAPGLRVEARAPDGVIEAFSQPGAPGFNLCLQWHPEWRAASNAVSMQMLRAFGQACENYRERPRGPLP